MTIRDKILIDINSIVHPAILAQLYEFLQLLNKGASSAKGNKAAVLAFAGILNNEDAK